MLCKVILGMRIENWLKKIWQKVNTCQDQPIPTCYVVANVHFSAAAGWISSDITQHKYPEMNYGQSTCSHIRPWTSQLDVHYL